MRRTPLRALLWLAAVAAAPSGAHEFWIEPLPPLEPGTAVGVTLRVGDGFPGESYARNPRHLRRFSLRTAGGDRAVPGRAGDDPAGSIAAVPPGASVVVYEGGPSRTVLAAEAFNAYLAEEGLDEVIRLRRQRGESEAPGRERYARCAKSLVVARDAHGEDGLDVTRPFGLRLELVPERDPTDGVETELAIRALWEGTPLPGLLLRSFHDGSDGAVEAVRTDAAGRAVVRLGRPGRWMVSGVHMVESADPSADWESTWSSLTFVRVEVAAVD